VAVVEPLDHAPDGLVNVDRGQAAVVGQLLAVLLDDAAGERRLDDRALARGVLVVLAQVEDPVDPLGEELVDVLLVARIGADQQAGADAGVAVGLKPRGQANMIAAPGWSSLGTCPGSPARSTSAPSI
jgi:hypothetical protein